jgi:hypothetical protein
MPITWQPIETAPLDGTEVLTAACAAGVLIVRNARWVKAEEWLDGDAAEDGDIDGWWAYQNSVSQEMLEGNLAPKYWAPLPEGSTECS